MSVQCFLSCVVCDVELGLCRMRCVHVFVVCALVGFGSCCLRVGLCVFRVCDCDLCVVVFEWLSVCGCYVCDVCL